MGKAIILVIDDDPMVLGAVDRDLRNKYGTAVRDVTRGNGNCWLIATTKNVSGRPFNAYCWA